MTTSSPTPARAWLRALFTCCVVWLGICLLLALSISSDSLRPGRRPLGFGLVLWDVLPLFPPFVLLSWGFFLHARRWPRWWSEPRAMLLAYLASMALFMPVWMAYLTVVQLLQDGKPLGLWWPTLLQPTWFNRFYDLLLASGTFIFQVGMTARRNAQQREQAWRSEQTDNLRLRLALLQGQLEPHFLFNALNSISALVRGSDRNTALSALSRVSELLRYALRASQTDWVSVQQELDFVRDYLELQTLRFGAGLQLLWQLDDGDWSLIACPPLLFQPLVENAIRHGLEAHEGRGRIVLSLRRQDARLTLSVSNPMPDEGARQAGHGMGLAASRQRLTMLYGEDAAGLHTRVADGRFELDLFFPLREMHESVDSPGR
nr:histidine kinase [uncultured Roseateles sp.]